MAGITRKSGGSALWHDARTRLGQVTARVGFDVSLKGVTLEISICPELSKLSHTILLLLSLPLGQPWYTSHGLHCTLRHEY